MRVILLRNVTHKGRRYKAGELIEVDDKLARSMTISKLAEITPESPEKAEKAETQASPEAASKTAPKAASKRGRKAAKK